MKIQQFKYNSDNLGYLVYSDVAGIAIDGGATKDILEFARNNQIQISIVTNTHTHADHTLGNSALIERTDALFVDCTTLVHGQVLDLKDGTGLEVLKTPGHTMDSLCFKGDGFIVTGDTLFNGTVGNCFSGDLKAFYTSLKLLMDLPGNTLVYSGHDYVRESLTYARIIEPGNPGTDIYEAAYNPEHVVSCIEDECKVNPYLRFNAPSMIAILEEKKLPADNEFDRFSSIMEVY